MTKTEPLILEAGRSEKNYWRDLWRYRELFFILAWRDVSVRYKQTVFGVAWALIRPFLTMIVFTIVFGRIAKLPSDGEAPYALLVLAGMLPWTLFSSSLSEASNSLVTNSNLISKVYFPRIVVPTASVIVSCIDFLIGFVLVIGLMIYYQFIPSWQVCCVPIFALLGLLASLGPSLYLTAMNVKYRDFRYIIPFIVQFGLYVSPVGFSSKVVPQEWQWLYNLNPIVGVIDGFRWSLLGGQSELSWQPIASSICATLTLLWLGIRKFRSTEKTFADVI
jgi:lipopolysaccharide transport system permease protein